MQQPPPQQYGGPPQFAQQLMQQQSSHIPKYGAAYPSSSYGASPSYGAPPQEAYPPSIAGASEADDELDWPGDVDVMQAQQRL